MDQQILDMAMELSGAGEAQRPLMQSLCAAAQCRWEARLPENVTAQSCGETFVCAAAFSAAADFIAGQSASAVAAFSAGEISVTEHTAADRSACASALRSTAEELMAPYAQPGAFSFRSVQG